MHKEAIFAERILSHGKRYGHRLAATFLVDGNIEQATLTYSELVRRAQALAEHLLRAGTSGNIVLLNYAPGLSFVEAFLACLLAEAVPAALPFGDHATAKSANRRSAAIVEAVNGSFLLSQVGNEPPRSSLVTGAKTSFRWQDHLLQYDPSRSSRPPASVSPDCAFVQFTSGTTSTPKGIEISHANLSSQLVALSERCSYLLEEVTVNWMPHYHDYGLVYGILLPLFAAGHCVLMAPSAFLRQPLRWLKAISNYRGSHSSAPVFGYRFTTNNLSPKEVIKLDLSTWKEAGIGAETISATVMADFVRVASPAGFEMRSFCPAYGLAEYTLAATYTPPSMLPTLLSVDREGLKRGKVITDPPHERSRILVGCGSSISPQTKLTIVDPLTFLPCKADEVGEIWISGNCTATRLLSTLPEATGPDSSDVPVKRDSEFLRTGDLGFLHETSLFVTGRLKEIIVIDGANFDPSDIEDRVREAHPRLRKATCAAFSVQSEDRELLVVLLEFPVNARDRLLLEHAIRSDLLSKLGIAADTVIFVRPGTLHKTSSGKLERSRIRQEFLENTYASLKNYIPSPSRENHIRLRSLEERILRTISEVTRTELTPGAASDHFTSLGLRSIHLPILAARLSSELHIDLSPPSIIQHPSAVTLSKYLLHKDVKPRQTEVPSRDEFETSPVAIIGMACALPQTDDVEAFWQTLAAGIPLAPTHDPTTGSLHKPSETLALESFANRSKISNGSARLSQPYHFDREFFRITHQDALYMDPQHRLLLEVTWRALEDARLEMARLAGSATGVFVGLSSSSSRGNDPEESRKNPYYALGRASAMAANRISYAFDLRGPSITVDTACSSSLVALDLACRDLARGAIDLALVAASNLILDGEMTDSLQAAGFLSPSMRSKAFDQAADGYVRSDGIIAIVLKRETDAAASEDEVIANIVGSAVKHGGRSFSQVAPNPDAQRDVIATALARAALAPSDVGYIEAHGTGTVLGDSVEVRALSDLFDSDDPKRHQVFIGSSKAIYGHTEAAAGLMGVIKAAKMLQRREMPPHPIATLPIDLLTRSDGPLRLQATLQSWPSTSPSAIGVSSFGFGGTNAHAILQASLKHENAKPSSVPIRLFTLSAPSLVSLHRLAALYRDHLAAPNYSYSELCYSVGFATRAFPFRLAVVAEDIAACRHAVACFLQGNLCSNLQTSSIRSAPQALSVNLSPGWCGISEDLIRLYPALGPSSQSSLGSETQAPDLVAKVANLLRSLVSSDLVFVGSDQSSTTSNPFIMRALSESPTNVSVPPFSSLIEEKPILNRTPEPNPNVIFESQTLWLILAALYLEGAALNWPNIGGRMTRIRLPRYPLNVEEYRLPRRDGIITYEP